MAKSLVEGGKHKVIAITRADSTSEIADGIEVRKVDYGNQSSLVEALRGVDVLIITMAVTAPLEVQRQLIEAAATAGVPWILPNEYGGCPDEVDMQNESLLGPPRVEMRGLIEKLGKSSWIAVICSFWYEYSLGLSDQSYGFNFQNRTVTFYDEGKTRINTTTWPQVGRAVASLLSLKVLPDDENDKSPSLSKFRDAPLYISSFKLSQSDMLESVKRVTGGEWTISYEPTKERFERGRAKVFSGDRSAFQTMLYARVFYPDGCGDYESKKGLHNELLGLPKEDLDQATKVAVDMAKALAA